MTNEFAATPSQTRLSWKAKVGLILFGLFVIAVVLEGGIRVVEAYQATKARQAETGETESGGEAWAKYDPDLGYVHNPEFPLFNAQGLRDHPIGPKAGRFRVLMLGDSVGVYGDDADDTFVGHLRKRLREQPGSENVDVVNASMKGYTNYQELLYLKKYGVQFEPDLVGVEFCLNDLHKFLHSFRVENGRLLSGSYTFSDQALQESRSWPRRILSRSRLLVWLKNNSSTAANVVNWQRERGFYFDYDSSIRTAWQDDPWTDIEQQLAEMVSVGKQRGFGVFLVVVPLKVQYRAEYLARDRNYVLKPQRKLEEICQRLGIPFHDLYPDMNSELFLVDEIHLTQPGRVTVGRKIADFLLEQQLIPAKRPNRGGEW